MDRFTTKENPRADLTSCIYCPEYSNCYSGMSCPAIYNALCKLRYYEDLEGQEKLIILPCKEGDTIYKIVKYCESNTGRLEFYRPSIEFEDDCEYYEPACYMDDYERCNAQIEDDDKEPWCCSFNLDILCEKCKERFTIEKDKFTLSKVRQIFNTPMFNENTSLNNVYYLSLEDAENALNRLKGN